MSMNVNVNYLMQVDIISHPSLTLHQDMQLQGPVSVSVGPDGCVCVVEYHFDSVSVSDVNGKYIKSFGKRGNKDGDFEN